MGERETKRTDGNDGNDGNEGNDGNDWNDLKDRLVLKDDDGRDGKDSTLIADTNFLWPAGRCDRLGVSGAEGRAAGGAGLSGSRSLADGRFCRRQFRR